MLKKFDMLSGHVKDLERLLAQLVQTEKEDNFYHAMRYALEGRGKRIRPLLCFTACKALNGDPKAALPYATAIELIHNFSLIHDDIEDGDVYRRNKLSVWKKYGLAHGVNIGDGMFALAYKALFLSQLPTEIIVTLGKVLTKSVLAIAEGQSIDINFRNQKNVTEEEYMRSIGLKTGTLLGASLQGGAIIANASLDVLNGLINYGHSVGLAFQIRDDIIDLTVGKGRKEIGCDIKEGKRSLLVVHALSQANPEEKKKLLSILDKNREQTTSQDIEEVISLFKKYHTVEYAQSTVHRLVERAINNLANFPNSEGKEALIYLAKFIGDRET